MEEIHLHEQQINKWIEEVGITRVIFRIKSPEKADEFLLQGRHP